MNRNMVAGSCSRAWSLPWLGCWFPRIFRSASRHTGSSTGMRERLHARILNVNRTPLPLRKTQVPGLRVHPSDRRWLDARGHQQHLELSCRVEGATHPLEPTIPLEVGLMPGLRSSGFSCLKAFRHSMALSACTVAVAL